MYISLDLAFVLCYFRYIAGVSEISYDTDAFINKVIFHAIVLKALLRMIIHTIHTSMYSNFSLKMVICT